MPRGGHFLIREDFPFGTSSNAFRTETPARFQFQMPVLGGFPSGCLERIREETPRLARQAAVVMEMEPTPARLSLRASTRTGEGKAPRTTWDFR